MTAIAISKKTATKSTKTTTATANLAKAIKAEAEKLAKTIGLSAKETKAKVKAAADEILTGLSNSTGGTIERILTVPKAMEAVVKKACDQVAANIAKEKAEAEAAAKAEAEKKRLEDEALEKAVARELGYEIPSEKRCVIMKKGDGKVTPINKYKDEATSSQTDVKPAAPAPKPPTQAEIEAGLAKARMENPEHVTLLAVSSLGVFYAIRWFMVKAIQVFQTARRGTDKRPSEREHRLQGMITLMDGIIEEVFRDDPKKPGGSSLDKDAAREHLGAAGYGWILDLAPAKPEKATKDEAPKAASKPPKEKNPEAIKARQEFISGLNAALEAVGVNDAKLAGSIIKDYAGAEIFPIPVDALRIKARNLQMAHEDTGLEGFSAKALICAKAAGITEADLTALVTKKREEEKAKGDAQAAAHAAKLDKPARPAAPAKKTEPPKKNNGGRRNSGK